MSAQPSVLPSRYSTLQPQEAVFLPMHADALAPVMAIECAAYRWPWSEGNMRDSIAAGHCCMMLCMHDVLLGYFVAMPGVEEVHLLNITVAPEHQGQGWARVMLDALCDWALQRGAPWIWLEVRQSNLRAVRIYERYGFRQVSLRKGYYPLDGLRREDAIVMSLNLRTG